MSQWNSKNIGQNLDALQSGVLDEFVVILMQGKNPFGDRIYSYLRLTVKDVMRLKKAMDSGQNFTPSDFGTVVAAGKGEPTDEVKAEIASMYKLLDTPRAFANTPATPQEEKRWDEY